MASIFVTRKIPDDGITLLKEAGHDVTVSEKDGALTHDELIARLKEKSYDAVLCLLTDTIDARLMEEVPSVKIFANYAVGFDNIDVAEAARRGIAITNTPDVLTDAVAEYTFALMLALAKRIPEADRYTREGKYTGWGPMLFLSPQVFGKTLGLVGAGRIGSRVAEFANMFGVRTVYYDIKQNASLEKLGIEFQPSLDALISEADFISLHVPLLDSTRHLIDAEAFSKMKPTAFLINTSRGPVVDEAALVSALKAGTLAGAALDVFEHEPALAPGLLEFPNVIATPHIASATSEARSNMSRVAGENILAVLQGEIPPDNVAV